MLFRSQVVKDPLGGKGARLTTFISLPSRYLVFMPRSAGIGISARIEDETERTRLREIVQQMVREGHSGGYIVRTAAEGVDAERLRAEGSVDAARAERMNRVNPKYVLRNYLAQQAIEQAQQKNYGEIDRLLSLLQDPFSDRPDMESYAAPPPNWGKHLAVSCSS